MSEILIIDDNLGPFEPGLRQALRGHRLHLAYSGPEGLDCLDAHPEIEVVLLDIMMPPELADTEEREGLEVLARIQETRPDVPVIMLTALEAVDTVVDAIQGGAFHYITKPIDRDKLRGAVERASETARLRHQVTALARAKEAVLTVRTGHPKARDRFHDLIGAHPLMLDLYEQIERAARFDDMNVVILGETGAGKDLVARALHACSPRGAKGKPFVAENCAALAESVLEAELFGYEKGAFTGADHAREGLFARANGGTLFLDEIGEMSPALQTKLLRAIENHEVRPVGGSPIPVDVRVVCATHRDLTAAKDEGTFREDLYYRIWDIPLSLPPLRARKEDIPLLARHFIADCAAHNDLTCSIDRAAERALLEHDWPGNVRELAATLRRLVVFAHGGRITGPLVRDCLGLGPAPEHEEHDEPAEAFGSGPSETPAEPATPADDTEMTAFPKVDDIAAYKRQFGERRLRQLLERAVREGGGARGALELLGMPESRYAGLRKWLQRLGVQVRQVRS